MLSSAVHPFRSNRLNECILRRRARNLRAKIKALLPVDICSKHSRRNRNVKEMSGNREEWRKEKGERLGEKHRGNKWGLCQEGVEDLYFEVTNEGEQDQRFEKLSAAEIEQIKEDKIYYIGEEHIKEFENFLAEEEGRKRQKQECIRPPELQSHSPTHTLSLKRSLSHHRGSLPKRAHPNRNHSSNSERSKVQPQWTQRRLHKAQNKQNKNQWAWTQRKQDQMDWTQNKWDSCPQKKYKKNQWTQRKEEKAKKLFDFQERRKVILSEDRSKEIMGKIKIRIKMERAEESLRGSQDKLMGEISKRKAVEDQRVRRVQTRQTSNRRKGEIKRLESQLRKTFLAQSPRRVKFDVNM